MRIFSYFFDFKRTIKRTEIISTWKHSKFLKSPFIFKLLGLSTVTILSLNLFHHEVYAKNINESDEKLINVIMITRHGARTPLKIVSRLDEVILFKIILKNN